MRPIGVLLFFLGLFCVSQADAYELSGLKWPQPTTTFYVDISGADGLWNDSFETAMYSWGIDTNFKFMVVRGVYEDPCDPIEDRNGVGFELTDCGDAWGSTTLAVTHMWYVGTTFIQTDIIFNSNELWNVYSTSWSSWPWSGVNDFQRVAIHELGHALGLDHENRIPSIMGSHVSNITMLQQDDINGVAAIYGFPDRDYDNIPDHQDNCPNNSNANQVDTDNDGVGDVCDLCPLDENKSSPGICGCGVLDIDSDNDGILNCIEDTNHNDLVDADETDPANIDTDGDGIHDGTELGYTLEDITVATDTDIFQPDIDPSTQTNPLLSDTDDDGKLDGVEDENHNGIFDTGESDPLDLNDPCGSIDYFVVHPMCSTYASSDTDRVVFFNSSQSSCYEMVSCVKEDQDCVDEWNFGGLGSIVGGNGHDIIVYQYDASGDYSASLTTTEQNNGTTVTNNITVTAEIVQTSFPAINFSTEVSSAAVSLTIADLDPTDSNVASVIVFWGDRNRDEYFGSLPTTINHTYIRTNTEYHIRVKAILTDGREFNYTFMANGGLTVSIP